MTIPERSVVVRGLIPRLHRFLDSLWRDPRTSTLQAATWLVLVPASVVFRAAVAVRNLAFDRGLIRAKRSGGTVVSVGNLAVGGTGKTPTAAWIVDWFSRRGLPVALVTRGYGADEVALHERWHPDVPVFADADRVAAATAAVESGRSVAVLDDGFQHRRLARDLDIVLLAADDPETERMLPWGPYRERASAVRRADLVLVTHRTGFDRAGLSSRLAAARRAARGIPVAPLGLRAGRWMTLDGADTGGPEGSSILAVCSIGRPEAFRRTVASSTALPLELMAFPDHWDYSEEDAAAIRARAGERQVVTTEKDAVKLVHFQEVLPETKVLGLEVERGPGTEALAAALSTVVPTEAGAPPP